AAAPPRGGAGRRGAATARGSGSASDRASVSRLRSSVVLIEGYSLVVRGPGRPVGAVAGSLGPARPMLPHLLRRAAPPATQPCPLGQRLGQAVRQRTPLETGRWRAEHLGPDVAPRLAERRV